MEWKCVPLELQGVLFGAECVRLELKGLCLSLLITTPTDRMSSSTQNVQFHNINRQNGHQRVQSSSQLRASP